MEEKQEEILNQDAVETTETEAPIKAPKAKTTRPKTAVAKAIEETQIVEVSEEVSENQEETKENKTKSKKVKMKEKDKKKALKANKKEKAKQKAKAKR